LLNYPVIIVALIKDNYFYCPQLISVHHNYPHFDLCLQSCNLACSEINVTRLNNKAIQTPAVTIQHKSKGINLSNAILRN
jgi:hypothetical protein